MLFAALFAVAHVLTLGGDGVTVTIDNQPVVFDDQEPILVDGVTLVPIRFVFEDLGFTVGWERATRTATLTRADATIVISINSTAFTTNGISHNLDVPAQLRGGRTMVPLRAVLESVGYTLDWDSTTRTVSIFTQADIVADDDGEQDRDDDTDIVDDESDDEDDENDVDDMDADADADADDDADANDDQDDDTDVGDDADTDADDTDTDDDDTDDTALPTPRPLTSAERQFIGIWEADTLILDHWWAYVFYEDGTGEFLGLNAFESIFQWSVTGDIITITGYYILEMYFTIEDGRLTLTDIEDPAARWSIVYREERSWRSVPLIGYWQRGYQPGEWRGFHFFDDGTGALIDDENYMVPFVWFVNFNVIQMRGYVLGNMYFRISGNELVMINRNNTDLYDSYVRMSGPSLEDYPRRS